MAASRSPLTALRLLAAASRPFLSVSRAIPSVQLSPAAPEVTRSAAPSLSATRLELSRTFARRSMISESEGEPEDKDEDMDVLDEDDHPGSEFDDVDDSIYDDFDEDLDDSD